MNRWWCCWRPPLMLLTLALAACGQLPSSGSETSGLEASDSEAEARTEANADADQGNWISTSRLSPQTLMPDGLNSLTYERALTASNGWGPIEPDRSNGQQAGGDGKPLTLNGAVYPKGYGVHAPSELKYSLAGSDNAKCVRFKAQIGLDDEVGTQGSAVFQVWGDTGKLYDSGLMTGASATQQVSVDVRRQASVRLVVTDGGNGKSFDHADWVNPALVCVPDISVSVPSETRMYQDTHGSLPLTITNKSRAFRGDVTYSVKAYYDTANYFQLVSTGTRLTGAAQQVHALRVFMGRRYTDDTFPADLVVQYAGEEVARTPLNLGTLEQQAVMQFPDALPDLQVGKPVVISVPVSVLPGGETTGLHISVRPNVGQAPDWLDASVVGSGNIPKEGGVLQIKLTATRAAFPDEPTEAEAQLRLYEDNFDYAYPVQIGILPVRLAPPEVWVKAGH
ncbi:NPCBM/NEW2 domain-containing protein [Deinococcus sp. Arct2-2]|uniref:NPCBM/NEW2 domain-containing protein n=1 Tax=Deinococcus sp. Arct2-2 TaxID=2568653 RepID=UPI001454BFD4|nr:NPCBM/NEW2 domain-containing protein [Deinococcus sp. Arct2-2]